MPPSPTLPIVQRIEDKLDKFVDATTEFRVNYAKDHQAVVKDVEDNAKDIAKLEQLINKNTNDILVLQKSVAPLVWLTKILSILAAAMGTTLIAFIWALITHQITIVVP